MSWMKKWWKELILAITFVILSVCGHYVGQILRKYNATTTTVFWISTELLWNVTAVMFIVRWKGITFFTNLIKGKGLLNSLRDIFADKTQEKPNAIAWNWFRLNRLTALLQGGATAVLVFFTKIPWEIKVVASVFFFADFIHTSIVVIRSRAWEGTKKVLVVRQAVEADAVRLEELDRIVYPNPDQQAVPGSIQRRVATFPQGVFVAEYERMIYAALYLRPIRNKLDESTTLTWEEAENAGDFTPPLSFEYLYGVGLVSRRGAKLADLVMLTAMRWMVKQGVVATFFGSRIPTLLQAVGEKPSTSEVQRYVVSGKDWEINLYTQARPTGLEMVYNQHGFPVVIPDYFSDPESCNYGVLWRWTNRWLGRKKWFGWAFFTFLISIERWYLRKKYL